jgi:hypothetical protein
LKFHKDAFKTENLDCFRYLVENDFPFDTDNKVLVKKINQLKKEIETTKKIMVISLEDQVNNNVINHIINKFV